MVCMDNLLCDEVWLSKSANTFEEVISDPVALKSYENEEFEEVFAVCLEKEVLCLPEPDYTKYLHYNNFIFPSCRVIQWFIKDWEYWMLELLSIACLSIAIKLNEISGLSLHEIQLRNDEMVKTS
ncbi:hypothetical protein JHK86_015824 [Glycine max]|nr:hypothetical protein JHK86_015824 [Glycine max]